MLGHYKVSGKPAGADTTLVGGPDWDTEHEFDGDATGGLLVRDSSQPFGAAWITGVATGRVLVSGGVGVRPAWSAAPSLTSLTLSTPLAAGSGGTGQSSFAIGDLLYASGAAALSKLADVATGQVLVSGGVGAAPAWSATPTLTSLTLGTALAAGSGGTGQSSYAVGDLLYASGAAALSKLADVATGSVLVSGGVTTAPAWSTSPTLTKVLVGDGLVGTPAFAFSSETGLGFYRISSGVLGIANDQYNASAPVAQVSTAGLTLAGTSTGYRFTADASAASTVDTSLTRGGAAGKVTIVGTTPMLQFGSTANTAPAFKASSAVVQARLADDSAFADLSAAIITAAAGTATPAAGSTAARLLFGTTAGFGIYYGSNAPTVSAAQGSLYLRSDGSSGSTRLYVNTNGTTGWTNVTTAT
jgi:hypothetical protein